MSLTFAEQNAPFSTSLVWALRTLAVRQSQVIDRLGLQAALGEALHKHSNQTPITLSTASTVLSRVCKACNWQVLAWPDIPDATGFPVLTYHLPTATWMLIERIDAHGQWLIQTPQGQSHLDRAEAKDCAFFSLKLIPIQAAAADQSQPAAQMIRRYFWSYKGIVLEGALASLFVNALALVASFYSMQVYDRVIPTQGYSTLMFLSIGVGLCILFELLLKVLRSKLMEHAVVGLDAKLSRDIFERLLSVRADQLPPNVGSLAGQLRAYESIRALLTASTVYLLVDLPFAMIFIVTIALLGNPILLWIPLGFLLSSLLIGGILQHKIKTQTGQAALAGNLKTGLLVEAVEGFETIKASGGQWKLLSRWMDIHAIAIGHDLRVRHWSELGGYLTASFQQLAYASLVALGAWQVMEGHMSMGALIACTMLSGRALAPAGMLCALLVQVAQAKAALAGLERIYSLRTDQDALSQPLLPQKLHGDFRLEAVKYAYSGQDQALLALSIPQLHIAAGQRVGVLGPVGCGKSSLLKLLAGLYRANEGKVLLDQLDIAQIARALLSEQIGYLQQEHRLLLGSLRENLLLGLPDPGDEALLHACKQTGLIALIASHPLGLNLKIAEGGQGLSGGQKQLVALTRLLLAQPHIWLLDEPTAHLDDDFERRCILALSENIKNGQTAVIVTHRPALLALVDHLIVMGPQRILLQGPRDEVLLKLRQTVQSVQAPQGSVNK